MAERRRTSCDTAPPPRVSGRISELEVGLLQPAMGLGADHNICDVQRLKVWPNVEEPAVIPLRRLGCQAASPSSKSASSSPQWALGPITTFVMYNDSRYGRT